MTKTFIVTFHQKFIKKKNQIDFIKNYTKCLQLQLNKLIHE